MILLISIRIRFIKVEMTNTLLCGVVLRVFKAGRNIKYVCK